MFKIFGPGSDPVKENAVPTEEFSANEGGELIIDALSQNKGRLATMKERKERADSAEASKELSSAQPIFSTGKQASLEDLKQSIAACDKGMDKTAKVLKDLSQKDTYMPNAGA